MSDWMRAPSGIQSVLDLIRSVPGNRRVIRPVEALMRKGELSFAGLPPEVSIRLKSVAARGEPAGAAAVLGPDGVITVYWHPGQPLGVAVALIYHELIHCLDDRYWKKMGTASRTPQRARARERAERRAFRAQARFVRRLARRFPSHAAFLRSAYPGSRLVAGDYSANEIRDLYRRQDGSCSDRSSA